MLIHITVLFFSMCGMSWMPGTAAWCSWRASCRILQKSSRIKPSFLLTSSHNPSSSTKMQHRWLSSVQPFSARSSAPTIAAHQYKYIKYKSFVGYICLIYFSLPLHLTECFIFHILSFMLDPKVSSGVRRYSAQRHPLVRWGPVMAQCSLLIHNSKKPPQSCKVPAGQWRSTLT